MSFLLFCGFVCLVGGFFFCLFGFWVFFKQVNTGTAESVTAEESNPKKHAFICSSLKREREKKKKLVMTLLPEKVGN